MKHKARGPVVALILTMSAFSCVSVHANLIAHWTLDESCGTRAYDSTGHGYDGCLLGGISFENDSADGKIGNGLHFDGSDDRMFVDSLFLPTNAFTISYWLRPDRDIQRQGRMYLLFWAGPQRPNGDKPYFVFNKGKKGILRIYTSVGDSQYSLDSKTADWKRLQWYHVAVTFDYDTTRLYVNGVMEAVDYHQGKHFATSGASFGARPEGEGGFQGTMDDIRIYDHVLGADEIQDLAGLDPAPQALTVAVVRAETMIRQEPKKAVSFLQERITQAQDWANKLPKKYLPRYNELSFDLHFALARAKEAAHLAVKDVNAEYQLALMRGVPSPDNTASILLWLMENHRAEQYQQVVDALNKNKRDYLRDIAKAAENMISSEKQQAAVEFLQNSLDSYTQWHKQHPGENSQSAESLSAVHFQLARAKRSSGASVDGIAEAYANSLIYLGRNYASRHAQAVVWLVRNGRTSQYTTVIKKWSEKGVPQRPLKDVVRLICQKFNAAKDWNGFEQFLNVLLTGSNDSFKWEQFIESCLANKTDLWAKTYVNYLEKAAVSKFGWDRTAEKLAFAEDFTGAVKRYQKVLESCRDEIATVPIRLRFCKCLFRAGQYNEALDTLNQYIPKYFNTNTPQTPEAILLQGHCLLQLGRYAKAAETFLALTTQYPNAPQAAESRFLAGYCYMLQKDFDKGREVMNHILSDYPQTAYAGKAALCLARMQDSKG